MKDLTRGPVGGHLARMAIPMASGMLLQTVYVLIDIYFVSYLGRQSIAGVSAASVLNFIVIAFTQVLSVGSVALASQSAGRKDTQQVNLLFNQVMVIGSVAAVAMLIVGYAFGDAYLTLVTSDAPTRLAGSIYLRWFTPCLALQFIFTALASTLRATGVALPSMIAQMFIIVLNIVLAPLLIAGIGSHHGLGVAGAGLASSISVAAGALFLAWHFFSVNKYVTFSMSLMRPNWQLWRRVITIGLPAGGEYLMMFLFIGLIYWCIKDLGAGVQAGFGIGSRLLQSLFLPLLAVAMASTPIIGQNFGGRQFSRVRLTFWLTLFCMSALSLLTAVIFAGRAESLIRMFSNDQDTIVSAVAYLRIMSWSLVVQAVIYSCSAFFQGIGDSMPALLSTATRIFTFALPAIWLSQEGGFHAETIWYLSVSTFALQAIISTFLARAEIKRRLSAPPAVTTSFAEDLQ
jgi:putative MATE family efflux protein